MANYTNNINNVSLDSNDDINAVNVSTGENTGINFGYAAKQNYEDTKLYQEVETAREDTMTDILSGVPQISEVKTLNLPEDKPDLNQNDVSKSFTVRDEIMSKLNLMDENYNYTDTYTNYINQGGQPLPGYEYAHKELLDQERYDSIFKQVEDGTLNYDTALMEAYGRDILATMGYDVTSVAYWRSKFSSGDYSHPFNNRYLMDQVKSAAESYHQQRLASEYGNRSARDTQLGSLVGKELSYEQIKNIFGGNWSEGLKSLDDTKLLQALHTGSLSQGLRLIQDGEGTYYYLHTDGQLYKCDNQNGDGHAKITFKSDGSPESIEIGQTHIKSFTSGFAGVFTGIAKLVTNTIQFAGEGISMLWDQDFDIENATSLATAIDNYLGDNYNYLTDSGYVDFDQAFSWTDATHLGCSLLGTVAGTMLLGGATSWASNTGTSLMQSNNAIAKVGGGLLKGSSQAFRWSTGNFGDYALGQPMGHIWGMRMGAAGVSAFKSYMQDVQKMNLQRMSSEDPSAISDGQIISRALQTNAINGLIDLAIGGGMQDNQWQAWTGRDTVSKAARDSYKEFIDSLTDKSSNAIIESTLKDGAFKTFVKSQNWVIKFNTAMDFASNLITAGISKQANINDKGEFEKADLSTLKIWDMNNMGTTMQAAFNSYWYSYRSQKKDQGYNIAFNSIREVNDTILNKFDDKIAKLTKADNITALSKLKQQYLDEIKNSKADTPEGKILSAIEKLNDGLTTDNTQVADFIRTSFEDAVNPKKVEMYRKMYDVARTSYYASLSRAYKVLDVTQNKTTLIRGLINGIKYGLNGEQANTKTALRTKKSGEQVEQDLNDKLDVLNKYLKYADGLDTINKNITEDTVRDSMSKNIRYYNGLQLPEKLAKKFSNMTPAELSKTYFLTVDNAAFRDEDWKIVDCAYDIAKTLQYVTEVDPDTHTIAFQIDDGEDYLNACVKLSTITQGVMAVAQNPAERVNSITAMIDNLDYQTEYQKSALTLNVIDKLKDKGVLTDRDAIKILDDTIGLDNKKDISKMTDKSVSNRYNEYVKMKEILTALANSSKGEIKLNLGDPDTMSAVQKLLKSNTISSDLKAELQAITKDDSFFLSGDAQGFRQYLDFEIKKRFKTDKELSPDSFIGKMNKDNLKEDLELYVSKVAPKANKKDITYFVNKVLGDMRRVYNDTTVVEMRDNYVILNLNNIRGKYTEALIKDVEQRADASYKGYSDPKKFDNHVQVAKELDAKSKLIMLSEGYSPVQYIDITNKNQREKFNSIMQSLNYDVKLTGDIAKDKLALSSMDTFGINYYTGDRVVLKMPNSKLQSVLEDAFTKGYIQLSNGKSIPLGKVQYYDANGNKTVHKPDVVSTILANTELINLDPNLEITLREEPLLGLLPFNPQTEYHKDTLVTTILEGIEKLGIKRGKLASQSSGLLENHALKSAASVISQDTKLANFLAIDTIVNHLFSKESRNKNLRIATSDLKQLKNLGLVDTEDSFWQSLTSESKKIKYITLKPDVTKEQMQDYILSKDFNMYKILPLIGYYDSKEYGQDMTSQSTTIKPIDNTQTQRNTLLDVLNIDFAWDNNAQDFKKQFFKKFLDGSTDYVYNPLKGHKFKYSDTDLSTSDWDTYKDAIKNSKDPYDILVNRYLDAYEAMAKATDGTKSEMWRPVVKNKRALQLLADSDEVTPELVQKIKDLYENPLAIPKHQIAFNNRRSTYSANSYQQPSKTVVVNTDALTAVLGGEANVSYKIRTAEGLQNWIPSDLDIEKAFDYVKGFKDELQNVNSYSNYDTFLSARFIENPVTRILSIIGGADGHIAIEDCDELAELIGENYRQIMDRPVAEIMKKIKYNDNVLDLFKTLYGNKANDAIESIIKKAKLLPGLQENLTYETRKIGTSRSASQVLNKNVDISSDLANIKTMDESWEAYIAKQRINKRDNAWQKLADATSDMIDYYSINKGARDRELNDRLNEQRFPGNSLSYNYTTEFNSNGPQYSAINTAHKLSEMFGIDYDKHKDKLMDSAITLVNRSHGNTQYTGNTTKYAVIDKTTGELLDMETWGRESLTDMLQPILDNKKKLIGNSILYVDNQDITDITALNMSVRDINNEQDYKDLVTDAYMSWAYDNMYFLKRALNTNDSNTVLEMLPKMKQETLRDILDSAPRLSMTEKEESLAIWNSVEPYWALDKTSFLKVFKNAYSKNKGYENNEATYNVIERALNKDLGIDESLNKTSDLEMRLINSVRYGMDNSLLNDNEREALRLFKSSILDDRNLQLQEMLRSYFDGDPDALRRIKDSFPSDDPNIKRDAALMYLAFEDSTANTDFLVRKNRSLTGMNMIRNRKASGSDLVISKNGDKIPTRDVYNALNSIASNEANTSKYSTLIWYDTETTNIKSNQLNSDSVFSVAFYIKKYEDGKWNTYEIDAMLSHDTDPEVWFKNNIDTKDSFYLDNPAYKTSVQNYKKGIGNFYTADELKAELSKYIDVGQTLLFGHNADNSDLPWLKNNKVFDDELLKGLKHIDTIYIAATNLKDERAKKTLSNQGLYDYFFNKQDNSAHGALADAKVTSQLTQKLVEAQYNIDYLKTEELGKLEKFMDELGYKLNDSDYKAIDAELNRLRDEHKSELDNFKRNYTISTDKVAALSHAFTYSLQKDYSKLIYEAFKTEYELDESSKQSILAGDFHKVDPILAYALENNILDKAYAAINKIASEEGFLSDDKIINTISTDIGIKRLMSALNIKEEDLKDISTVDLKSLLSKDISKDPGVSEAQIDAYNSLHGTFNFIKQMQAVNDLITDPYAQNIINLAFLTAYDFSGDIEDLDMFLATQKPNFIETKWDKQREEILNSAFGDVRALFNIPVSGKYSLITSFKVGGKLKDALTGEYINADSSMAIVSREEFESLMGDSLDNYRGKGELYTNIMIHPADGNNKIHACRIVVSDKIKGMSLQIPETMAETLLARDFDGDHVIMIKPDEESQELLKAYANTIYKAHDVQEKTFNWLKTQLLTKDSNTNQIYSEIGRDAKIIELCRKADKLLSNGESIDSESFKNLTDAFRVTVSDILGTYDENKIKEVEDILWVKQFDTTEFEKKGRILSYIGNPAVSLTDKIRRSHSAIIKQTIDSLVEQQINKYLPIDSVTGEIQKNFFYQLKPSKIKNGYTDMIMNDIYGANVVNDYIMRLNPQQAQEFVKVVSDEVAPYITDRIKPDIERALSAMQDAAKGDVFKQNMNTVAACYDAILRMIEVDTKENAETDLLKIYGSENILNLWDRQRQMLEQKEKGVQYVNEYHNMLKPFWSAGGDLQSESKFNYVLNDIIKDSEFDSRIKYIDDFADRETCKTFVVTNGWPSSKDEILVNNKSENPFSIWRSERIKFNPTDEIQKLGDKNITKGDLLPAGFVITKGKHDIDKLKLDTEAKVLHIDKRRHEIVLSTPGELDGSVKLVTNEGSKGPVNNTYSIDDPTVTLVVNEDTMSRDKLLTSNGTPIDYKIVTKTIKGDDNRTYTVEGYVIDGVVPTVVEDSAEYRAKNGIASVLTPDDNYKIDHLHHCSDSKSVPGSTLMGGWYFTMKDGELTYDPTRVQNMINSLEHPERMAQSHNIIDGLQYLRMYLVLNDRTEEELQSAFKTTLSKSKIIKNKLNDIRVGSEQYNSEINWFINKYGTPNPGNELCKQLFSKSFNSLLGTPIQTGSEGVSTNNFRGKSSIGTTSAVDEHGNSTALYSTGRITSPEIYNADIDYDATFNDYYIPYAKGFRYLFGDDIPSSTKLLDWTKRGILNKGRFYSNANVSNGFKNTNEQYVQERNPLETTMTQKPVGISPKSGKLMDPFHYDLVSNLGVEPSLTNKKYLISHSGAPNNLSMYDAIIKREEYPYSNNVRIANVLHSLGSINPNMSKNEKVNILNDDKLFTISQMIPYIGINEDDNQLALKMTAPQYMTANAKDISKRINSTLHDFNYINTITNNKSFNIDELYKTVDSEKISDTVSEYKEKGENVRDVLDRVYKSLYDEETGIINEDVDVNTMYKDKNKARVVQPEVIKDKDKELIFNKSVTQLTASGLKENNADTISLGRAVKKQSSYASYVSQDALSNLTNLEETLTKSKMSEEEFKQFAQARSILAINEQIDEATEHGDINLANTLKEERNLYIEKLDINNAESVVASLGLKYQAVSTAYEQYINSINELSKEVQQLTGQPVANLITYLAPFKATDKKLRNAQVISTVKGMLNFDNKNPIKTTEAAITFDFFNSSKAMIKELSQEYGVSAIKDVLLDPDLNYASNESLIDKTYKMIDGLINFDNISIYDKDEEKKQEYMRDMSYVFDAISEYTDRYQSVDSTKPIVEQYKTMWDSLKGSTEALINKYQEDFSTNIKTYSEFVFAANDETKDIATRNRAQTIANYMWAKMVCAQGIIESSPSFAKQFSAYINSLYDDGYCLVNAFGQKFIRGQYQSPLTSTSMSNIKDNIGISYNSSSEAAWNQFILEKIISGEIYTLRNDVADYLEKTVYTKKLGSNTTQTLKNISKWSTALQMALPSRLINRILSFTGFDYSMAIAYDPSSIKYMGRARRDLLAAFQSNGKNMNPVLQRYMELEGQPVGLTGKDPITFSEDISGPDKIMKILNTMTDPLEFQNHLGRYAIYLTALEKFENGDPNYGPLYFKKDAIEQSNLTNEEKAMYVMDYMLGSPGGFPILSKKTSGYMLYATFPMAFTRTLGAYGMSIGKLATEGFTKDNMKHWMRTAGNPSMGVLAITALAAMITSIVCDLYGVEEDTKKDMIDKHVTIDPLGTILGGTPTASSSSMNPYANFEEMVITPFTDSTYNKNGESNATIFSKLQGFTNVNLLAHLNPAIKIPIEIATGKDIYAAAPIDTKYYYTGVENAARKLLGFFVGSSTGTAIVDQLKMDSYSNDSNFLDSLITGVKRGISNSVGNQKSYKKDTTNYYNNIYKINNYKYANSVYTDAEAEDLMDANYLNTQRNYSGKYGTYNKDDYKRISNVLRKMINNKAEPVEVYSVIVSEYNKGVSEATLRVVLDNCSIIRKLKHIDTANYLSTLSSKERASLSAAIEYEERMYPDLEKFFPDSISGYTKRLQSRKKYSSSGSGGYGSTYYPRTNYPRTIYPNSSSYYTSSKYWKPTASIDKVNVEVSPQMGVWINDYNEVPMATKWTNKKRKGPVKLLDQNVEYINNPYYNNLSDYEKKKKVTS